MLTARTHDHQAMMKALIAVLLAPDEIFSTAAWSEELARRLGPIVTCAECLGQLDATLRVLTRGADGLVSCAEVERRLPAYAELAPTADAAQQEAAARALPLVWLHLRTCARCPPILTRQRELHANLAAGVYGALPQVPPPRPLLPGQREEVPAGEATRRAAFVTPPRPAHAAGGTEASGAFAPRPRPTWITQGARRILTVVPSPVRQGNGLRLEVRQGTMLLPPAAYPSQVRPMQPGTWRDSEGAILEPIDGLDFTDPERGVTLRLIVQVEPPPAAAPHRQQAGGRPARSRKAAQPAPAADAYRYRITLQVLTLKGEAVTEPGAVTLSERDVEDRLIPIQQDYLREGRIRLAPVRPGDYRLLVKMGAQEWEIALPPALEAHLPPGAVESDAK